jgi:hypothetical protein
VRISKILLTTVLLTALASCGGSENSKELGTTVAPPSTAAAPDCSESAIEAGAGESVQVMNCKQDWAAVQSESLECGEHCYGWLLKWSDSKWNLMGSCSQYSALIPDNGCQGMSGLLKDKTYTDTWTDFPSKEVACQLWSANRYPENISETGCTPDPVG